MKGIGKFFPSQRQRQRFIKAKVHRWIRSLVEFAGVPKGTTGRVISADQSGKGFTLAIQWELPGRSKPLVDWFSRDEYFEFLEEING